MLDACVRVAFSASIARYYNTFTLSIQLLGLFRSIRELTVQSYNQGPTPILLLVFYQRKESSSFLLSVAADAEARKREYQGIRVGKSRKEWEREPKRLDKIDSSSIGSR